MTLAHSATAVAENPSQEFVLIDPRAPRFGQALTTIGLLAGIALTEPILIAGIAVVLGTAVLSGWRVDFWALLWRYSVVPIVGPPDDREAAAPHRFAKLLGAAGTGLAVVAFVVGIPLVGYVLAGAVAAAAGLAAVTGICLGCRMYRQVAFVRRAGIV